MPPDCLAAADRFAAASVEFSADLRRDGGGEITVNDYDTPSSWTAVADRAHITELHLVPEGDSQIDTITLLISSNGPARPIVLASSTRSRASSRWRTGPATR